MCGSDARGALAFDTHEDSFLDSACGDFWRVLCAGVLGFGAADVVAAEPALRTELENMFVVGMATEAAWVFRPVV